VTAFDWAAGVVLGVSAVVGLLRGATREVTGLMALVLAGVLALASGRLAGPLFDQLIHPAWLARPAGMAVVFVLAYVAMRLIGGLLARGVRGVGLSGPDRVLGLAIGLMRGVAVLGVFGLVLGAIVPADHTPGWIGRARLYPLARGAGAVIRAAAPIALAQASDDHPPSPRAHALVVVEDPH
jgi:membrane protein required for colicin V production